MYIHGCTWRFSDTVTMTRADLGTLEDEELLNDTVMDFYIKCKLYSKTSARTYTRKHTHLRDSYM